MIGGWFSSKRKAGATNDDGTGGVVENPRADDNEPKVRTPHDPKDGNVNQKAWSPTKTNQSDAAGVSASSAAWFSRPKRENTVPDDASDAKKVAPAEEVVDKEYWRVL
jgi:hypothetical protein